MDINLDADIVDIVNTKIRSLHPRDSLERAREVFGQTDRKIIPVISNHEFKGILHLQNIVTLEKANKYILKNLYGKIIDTSLMRVEDLMTSDVKVLSVRSKMIDALSFFVEKGQYFIPVLDFKDFVGLITPFDFFSYCIDLHENDY